MRKLAVLFILFGVAVTWTLLSQSKQDPTRAAGRTAATDDQKRLWDAAAQQGLGSPPLPVVERPVAMRTRVVYQDRKAQPGTVALPENLVSGVRILSAPELPNTRFAGDATVIRTEGERIDLDLGGQGTLSLLARSGRQALRMQPGAKVELDFHGSNDPYDRRQVLALKTADGEGLASVLESGAKPVTLRIPMFQLTARQIGRPEQNTMEVEVTVGGERQTMKVGQIAEFRSAKLTVGLLGSVAYEGDQAGAVEGNPFAINLTAWPTR